MPKYIESEHCPACGSPDYVTLHSDWSGIATIQLMSLRRCAECDTKYSPPISWWVSVSAIVLGALVVVGALFIAFTLPTYLAEDEHAARLGISLFFYLLAGLGAGFAFLGIARLVFRQPSAASLPGHAEIHFDD